MKIVAHNNLKHVSGGFEGYISQQTIDFQLYARGTLFAVLGSYAFYTDCGPLYGILAFPLGFAFGYRVNEYYGLEPGVYDIQFIYV